MSQATPVRLHAVVEGAPVSSVVATIIIRESTRRSCARRGRHLPKPLKLKARIAQLDP